MTKTFYWYCSWWDFQVTQQTDCTYCCCFNVSCCHNDYFLTSCYPLSQIVDQNLDLRHICFWITRGTLLMEWSYMSSLVVTSHMKLQKYVNNIITSSCYLNYYLSTKHWCVITWRSLMGWDINNGFVQLCFH